jgi:hypothetical protein
MCTRYLKHGCMLSVCDVDDLIHSMPSKKIHYSQIYLLARTLFDGVTVQHEHCSMQLKVKQLMHMCSDLITRLEDRRLWL